MGFRRNWFIYLSQILYMAASILILIFGVTQFSAQKSYPYLSQVIIIAGFCVVFILINLIFYLITRPFLVKIFLPLKKTSFWVEAIFVLLILGVGLALRIYYIQTYPVSMESDYKFYYDVANLIKDGSLLTKSNNEYIALFPHTYGYSYVLSVVMSIFGTAPEVCLYFNAVMGMLVVLFCYWIGKCLVGSAAGISALLITCFWPSQIIFSNINGAETTFTVLLYGAALLMVYVMKRYNGNNSRVVIPILLHVIIGVLLSFASAIRPMSLVFLIALVLCLVFLNYNLKYKNNINELSFGKIFLSKGILRAILVLVGYLICTQFITAGVSNAIQKNVAGNGAIGYSLMVGLDIDSEGGYSEESMNFLYDNYDITKSADEANKLCLDKAIASVKENPIGTLELFAKKIYLIWSNDDYATTTNIVTMKNQGLLTPEREAFLKDLAEFNNIYYFFIVLLAAIGVGYLFIKNNNAQVFAVFFIGAVVMHMLVEIQNRYHYYLLQNFAILAGVGVGLLFQRYLQLSKYKLSVKSKAYLNENQVLELDYEVAATTEDATGSMIDGIMSSNGYDIKGEYNKSKKQSLNLHTINVLDAIKEGHIIVTATKAYDDEHISKDSNSIISDLHIAETPEGVDKNESIIQRLNSETLEEAEMRNEPELKKELELQKESSLESEKELHSKLRLQKKLDLMKELEYLKKLKLQKELEFQNKLFVQSQTEVPAQAIKFDHVVNKRLEHVGKIHIKEANNNAIKISKTFRKGTNTSKTRKTENLASNRQSVKGIRSNITSRKQRQLIARKNADKLRLLFSKGH